MEENKELTPEEVKERKEKLIQYYTEQVDFLTVQLEYETLVTAIEEQRAKRVQFQVMVANMLAQDEEEEEAAPFTPVKRSLSRMPSVPRKKSKKGKRDDGYASA